MGTAAYNFKTIHLKSNKILTINDLHNEAPHAIYKSHGDMYLHIAKLQADHGVDDAHTFPMGDNDDFRRCKKKRVDYLRGEATKFQKRFEETFQEGNHELGVVKCGYDGIIIVLPDGRRFLLIHGDYALWGYARSYEYRNENKIGSGMIGRGFAWVLEGARDVVKYDAKDLLKNTEYIERAEEMMKLAQADGIMMGHKHPTLTIDILIKNKRHIIFDRGMRVVEL